MWSSAGVSPGRWGPHLGLQGSARGLLPRVSEGVEADVCPEKLSHRGDIAPGGKPWGDWLGWAEMWLPRAEVWQV